jgi:hypothetical protein
MRACSEEPFDGAQDERKKKEGRRKKEEGRRRARASGLIRS